MRFTRGDVRDPYRFIKNRSRISVVALKSDAAAEKPKDQLSRDFLGCSMFDFCNNIGAKRTFTEKLTSEKRQQEILLGCREDALPATGAPGSQLTCADWRAQGLRQRR